MIAAEELRVVARLRRLWIDEPYDVSVRMDVLVPTQANVDLPRSLAPEPGEFREFGRGPVPDDHEMAEFVPSLRLKQLPHHEQQKFAEQLKHGWQTGSLQNSVQIEEFDPWELEEADPEERGELMLDFD